MEVTVQHTLEEKNISPKGDLTEEMEVVEDTSSSKETHNIGP
jgi:hypothetical protein